MGITRKSALKTMGTFMGSASLWGLRSPAAHAQKQADQPVGKTNFNIKDFGAKGDGKTLDTEPIQKAIDACSRSGGGTVYIPSGRYLSGTLVLKSNINLHLGAGSVLLGSPNLRDYPIKDSNITSYTNNYTNKSLIYAENLKNLAITGQGTIDGQGKSFSGPYKKRPYMLRIINSQNVNVRGITLQHSPMWVQHYLECENVNIDGVTVHSKVNANNDGIDIDGCQKVRISNCNIWSGDDAIVLKATTRRTCRDITVTNCVLSTDCNAFKLGTESSGGFENIAMSNCTMYDVGLSGIAVEEVDGGLTDRISISNVTMVNVKNAIFIRLGNRARPPAAKRTSQGFSVPVGALKPGIGTLKNVIISNIQATVCDTVGCSITGLPDHPVENITLENIRITFNKGIASSGNNIPPVPDVPEAYPEYTMFGDVLPAYGFFCRHASNLNFRHVRLNFLEGEKRPALINEDIRGLRIEDFDAEISDDAKAVCRLKDVTAAFVTQNRPLQPARSFIDLEGKQNQRISIQGNDFASLNSVLYHRDAIPDRVIYMEGNRM